MKIVLIRELPWLNALRIECFSFAHPILAKTLELDLFNNSKDSTNLY